MRALKVSCILLALAGAGASPAGAQSTGCFATLYHEGRDGDYTFLDLGRNRHSINMTQSHRAVMNGRSVTVIFRLETHWENERRSIAESYLSVEVNEGSVGSTYFRKPSEVWRLEATLPDGRIVSGSNPIALIGDQRLIDGTAANDLFNKLYNGNAIPLRFRISQGGKDVLSVTSTQGLPKNQAYRDWAEATARKLSQQRTSSGQCPVRSAWDD